MVLLVTPFAEDFGADADHCAAALYCLAVVGGHTHRHSIEPLAKPLSKLLEECSEGSELALVELYIVRKRANGHQASHPYVVVVGKCARGYKLPQFALVPAALALVLGKVYLKEHIYNPPATLRLAVNLCHKSCGVHRVDECHEGGNALHLVGLEMSYHMPLHIGGHKGLLGAHLLWAALAKDALTGIVSLPKSLYGVEFGYCHKRHTLGEGGVECFYFGSYGHFIRGLFGKFRDYFLYLFLRVTTN